ncbi:hypothetical protein PW5551_05895 [Petrotoga sp. 9PW.55.5.1]|uniref:hypothetical protein n=1 Tax=Petrotoga sp. 9PW.55.5.1 TaxID=1308979 RepID=UPI000DC53A6F|nr:hypothetical protein [Petrotoga sp. 9PW.55.5.1]RAO99054.1 hypothetical protein PW5551_05895 [Petrotoga sp. 9PW.55.5.1]
MKLKATCKDYNKGFLLIEVVISLLVEIIFFSSISFFVVVPLKEYFTTLTEKFIASEMVYKTRSASMHYGEDYNLNGIISSQIVQGKIKIVTNDIKYYVTGESGEALWWYEGKIITPGGKIINSEGETIFNVVPVTGILTNPKK